MLLTQNGNNHGKYIYKTNVILAKRVDEIKGFYSNLPLMFFNLGLLA
jgi:hypothetical protein